MKLNWNLMEGEDTLLYHVNQGPWSKLGTLIKLTLIPALRHWMWDDQR